MMNNDLRERRFTTSAIHIVEQLIPRAADRSLFIRAEDTGQVALLLLWALLRWECKVGLAAIMNLGVNEDELARDVDRTLRMMPSPVGAQSALLLQIWPALEPLLVEAEHEAQSLAHDWVGSEHLFLALVRYPCPQLQQIWLKHDVDYNRAKATVTDLLKS